MLPGGLLAWLGNSAAVATSNAYYADHRTAHEAATELCVQVGVDAATNVVKEFYPKQSFAANIAARKVPPPSRERRKAHRLIKQKANQTHL
jgi:hypothetical protein